jgi:hypothetical protein
MKLVPNQVKIGVTDLRLEVNPKYSGSFLLQNAIFFQVVYIFCPNVYGDYYVHGYITWNLNLN